MPVLQFPVRPRAEAQARTREINPPKLLKAWLTLGAMLSVAPTIWWLDLLEKKVSEESQQGQRD